MSGKTLTGDEPRRLDRRPLAMGLVGVAIVCAVAVIDHQITRDSFGALDAPPGEFQQQIEDLGDTQDAFDVRSWIYALVALGMILAATVVTYQRTGVGERRELFNDLGVIGVVWLVGGVIALDALSEGVIDLSFAPLGVTAAVLLLVAAIGSFIYRRPSAERDSRGRKLHVVAAVLIAVLIGIGFAFGIDAPEPCANARDVPDWVGTLTAVDFAVIAIAVLTGLLALALRRWVTGLILLVLAPFAGLLALLTNVCLD